MQPFPIADPAVGLALFRDPWRSPYEALAVSRNVEVYRGRMQKRPGFDFFGRLVKYDDAVVNLDTGDGGATYTDLALASPILWPVDQGITVHEQGLQTHTFIFTDTELDSARRQAVGGPLPTGVVTKSEAGFSITIDLFLSAIRSVTFPAPVGVGDWIRAEYDYIPNVEVAVVGESLPAPFLGISAGQLAFPNPKPLSVTFSSGALSTTNTGWNPEVWSGGHTVALNWRTGAFQIFWAGTPGPTTTVSYTYFDPEAVQGLYRLLAPSGIETLLALSTKRVYTWQGAAFRDLEPGEPDSFSGSEDDLYWLVQSQDATSGEEIVVATNGVDPVKKINPAAALPADRVTLMGGGTAGHPIVDFDGVALPAEMEVARHVLQHRESVLYFDIDEGATRFSRRVRWTQPGQTERLEQFDFADAPTDDAFVGAVTWRDEVWVFFQRSIMRLRQTGNPDPGQLFEWIDVDDEAGLAGKFSVVFGQDWLTFLSKFGPYRFDGRTSRRTDEILGDYIDQIDPTRAAYSLGKRVRARRQTWLVHPDLGAQYANRILVQSLEGGQFTKWELEEPIVSMVDFERQTTLLVDDISTLVDDYHVIVDSAGASSGFPSILAARQGTGEVHVFPGQGFHDYHKQYPVEWRFDGLNPYLGEKQPALARLHMIQIYAPALPNQALRIEVFRDTESTPFLSRVVTIVNDGQNDKLWRTILVNEVATLFDIRITDVVGGFWQTIQPVRFALDAVVPYFSPEGPIYSRAGN